MFDALSGRPRSAGFLPAGHTPRPGVEALEDRAVPAVIGGIVYHDVNSNGIHDAGEAGIANSSLQLYDSTGRVIARTTSDASGNYQFTHRQSGVAGASQLTQEVTFDQARTNVSRTGTVPLFNSALGQLTAVEIIAQGQLTSAVQMENLESADSEMKAELNGSIRYQVGNTVLQSTPSQTVTGTLGAFDGQADMQGTSARDFGPTTLTGAFNAVTITDPNDLAAFVGDGALNIAQNATMASCAAGTGNLLAMIRSTASGSVRVVYRYQPSNGIGPGVYTVAQSPQPGGYFDGMETKDNVTPITGSNRTDYIRVGVATLNDQLTSNNFGEVRGASISGVVYHDANRSGALNAGDARLGGVTMTLTGTDILGNSISRTQNTDANGAYAFLGLRAGTYTVREQQPSSYLQGTNTIGTAGGTVAGDAMTVRLGSGVAGRDYNFGEWSQTPQPSTAPGPQPSKFFLISGYDGAFGW